MISQSNWFKKTAFLWVFLVVLQLPGFCQAAEHSSTNITVDSNDLEPFSLNKKTEPDEKPIFYQDQNMTVGINDDAEPNVSSRF